jgi:hypothetical protein
MPVIWIKVNNCQNRPILFPQADSTPNGLSIVQLKRGVYNFHGQRAPCWSLPSLSGFQMRGLDEA